MSTQVNQSMNLKKCDESGWRKKHVYCFNLRFKMVEIIGKRNQKVPVLLTPDVKNVVEALISTREDGNVSSANKYVFAINDGKSMKSFQGNNVTRQACSMVKP